MPTVCVVCKSIEFEKSGYGGFVCVECGTQLHGVVEELVDEYEQASGAQMAFRQRAGPSTVLALAPAASSCENSSVPVTGAQAFEAFQCVLQELLTPFAQLSGGGEPLVTLVRTLWFCCIPFFSLDRASAPLISLPRWRGVRVDRRELSLSPKFALSLLLAGSMQLGERSFSAEALLRCCHSGQIPVCSAHQQLPKRLRHVLGAWPSLVRISKLPVAHRLSALAIALSEALGLAPALPTLPALIAQLVAELRLARGYSGTAAEAGGPSKFSEPSEGSEPLEGSETAALEPLAFQLYERAWGAWRQRAASLCTHARPSAKVSSVPMTLAQRRSVWRLDAAAALLLAVKIRCCVMRPLARPHSMLIPTAEGVEGAAAPSCPPGVGAAQDFSQESEALWATLEPCLLAALLGPHLAEPPRQSFAQGVSPLSALPPSAPLPQNGSAITSELQLLLPAAETPAEVPGGALAPARAMPHPRSRQEALLVQEGTLQAYLHFVDAQVFSEKRRTQALSAAFDALQSTQRRSSSINTLAFRDFRDSSATLPRHFRDINEPLHERAVSCESQRFVREPCRHPIRFLQVGASAALDVHPTGSHSPSPSLAVVCL